jgi:release factor glutamine methyltransferase
VRRLQAAGVEGAARDARGFWPCAGASARPADAAKLPDDLTDPQAAARFDEALVARRPRQPVAQITGRRLFWGRGSGSRATRWTRAPRPRRWSPLALAAPFLKVLDLGTGTGCILVTCCRSGMPMARGVGTDISAAALEVAGATPAPGAGDRRGSAVGLVFRRHRAVRSDRVEPALYRADEMAGLAPEVRDWEPHLALTPGRRAGRLPRHRRRGHAHLAPGGRVLVEIGPTAGAAVAGLFRQAGLEDVAVRPDLDGGPRGSARAGVTFPHSRAKSPQNHDLALSGVVVLTGGVRAVGRVSSPSPFARTTAADLAVTPGHWTDSQTQRRLMQGQIRVFMRSSKSRSRSKSNRNRPSATSSTASSTAPAPRARCAARRSRSSRSTRCWRAMRSCRTTAWRPRTSCSTPSITPGCWARRCARAARRLRAGSVTCAPL